MRNYNVKYFLYLLAGFSIFVFYVIGSIKGVNFNKITNITGLISTTAAIDCIAYYAFTRFLWRINCLQGWLVPFPNINGTWQGFIQTSWKDEYGNIPGPIPVILTVRQTFNHLSCVMRTAEMESHSYLGWFYIEKDEQKRFFCYSYTSRPKIELRDRSTPHDGTARFNIIGEPVEKLTGEYWTQRKTTGKIELTFKTKKRLDDIPDDLMPHPMKTHQ